MRKFFKTPDGQLLEIDSDMNLSKTNIEEYDIKTSKDTDVEYMPIITKTSRGYVIKVNEKEHDEECCESHDGTCCKNRVIFIELDVDNLRMKRFLAEDEKPEVTFYIPHGKKAIAYAYSTKGGL